MRVRVPGRVNLIGDHVDHVGGRVLPMAIDRWTTLTGHPSERIRLTSTSESEPVDLDPKAIGDPGAVTPAWGRFAAAVAVELDNAAGFVGHIETTIPAGAGLSSSAALEIALALALGFEGDPRELAALTRRAEHRATGVATGIMDQLCIAAARAGRASLIDCHTLEIDPLPMPVDVDVVVVHVAHRTLEGSDYGVRVAQCQAAEREIGPLRTATMADVAAVDDPVVARRARHVVEEIERVDRFAEALRAQDLPTAGAIMVDGHRSLRDHFEVSTPAMDAAVERLTATPGVHGARMTGGGFGGCVVALCEPGALDEGWVVRPVGGPDVVAD